MPNDKEQELRQQVEDWRIDQHICDNEGYGCEYENYQAFGRNQVRCKLLRESDDRLLQLILAREKQHNKDILGFLTQEANHGDFHFGDVVGHGSYVSLAIVNVYLTYGNSWREAIAKELQSLPNTTKEG